MRRWLAVAVLAGAAIGAVYSVTPLTLYVIAGAVLIIPRLARGLPLVERRWLTAIVAAAVVARLVAVGVTVLGYTPVHDDLFVGAASGDEAYAMSRALRSRSILQGETTNKYDYFIAFDEYGRNRWVTALTAIQLIFGPTPYSLRLLNSLLYVSGTLLLFGTCRRAFGPVPAFAGLVVLLFWPTLFAWSISLLKEPLYFVGSATIVAGAIDAAQATRWRPRIVRIAAIIIAGAVIQGLRPAALTLSASGLMLGFAASLLAASKRRLASAALGAALAVSLAWQVPGIERRLIAGLEWAAKAQAGHVFTVGHAYKVLDAGFYFIPQTPVSSSLRLTTGEAVRYVVRAVGSFFVVPAPWQLRSARELVYLPEQLAWYVLLLALPVGIVAGCRRDRLTTCMLALYGVPTAMAVALTNGNVGTLLRLRGLVIPYLAWVSAVGFVAVLDTLGQRPMRFVDDRGRVLGRVNLFDAALLAFALILIPVAYGTFLLFRTPAPRITAVERVPITREERRVAGGATLTAKLKVHGSSLRPLLHATVGNVSALGFVFEGPNSADVLLGPVPPGTHDLVLMDGVHEVARLAQSVTIQAEPSGRVLGVGAFLHLDRATAEGLAPGPLAPTAEIVALGSPRPEADGRWQRRAELRLICDPDPSNDGCAVGGFLLTVQPLPTLKLATLSGTPLSFALTELLPVTAPRPARARVRFSAPPEVLTLPRAGDRDDVIDSRAATIVEVGARRATAGRGELDATIQLGVDESPDGWTYRGMALKAGAPYRLATERYVIDGMVLGVTVTSEGGGK
jgi:hypothetical protein